MGYPDQHQPLLQAAHSGDRLALERLLALCQPDIRRYARRNCLASDVDDAVQEAMLLVVRRLPTLKVLAAYGGWLFKLVQRTCLRLARSALRYDPYDDARAEQWLAAQDDAALRQQLLQALAALPPDYLRVILLRDVEELSVAEVARQLGVSEAAAKSRLHRARSMARAHLLD